MAAADLDDLIASFLPPIFFSNVGPTAVIGRAISLIYSAGIPGPAVASTSGVDGEALTSYPGDLPFPATVSGKEVRLERMTAQATQPMQVLLCDRLWHNSGLSVTSTASQSITTPTWPARDRNGTTDGEDVFVGLETTTANGAGTPTLTLGYTNSDGTAGRTATNIVAVAASAPIGTFFQFGLAAGDRGVRSIESFQMSATRTSGAHSLVAYRVIQRLSLMVAGASAEVDSVTGTRPKAWDNTVPFLMIIPGATTAPVINGSLVWGQA